LSETVRVLVVDDEEPARALLAELLSGAPGVELVGECANGLEAVRAASERRPDVMFLDIQMPKLDGFEVMELLPAGIAVVFVTAYDHYAVKAFEVEAVDYVLKPYRKERLLEALDRARARRKRPDPADLAAALRPPGTFAGRIAVREGNGVRVIPVERIDYAEARDDAVAIRSEGKLFLKAQTLGSLEKALDPARFLRVHRSYIVNVDRLRRVELYSKNSHIAILSDGSRIPISREGHARIRALLSRAGAETD
jgi:two-component system LytT family response regulator